MECVRLKMDAEMDDGGEGRHFLMYVSGLHVVGLRSREGMLYQVFLSRHLSAAGSIYSSSYTNSVYMYCDAAQALQST